MNLSSWTGAARPERIVLNGAYTRLEPLDLERHGNELLHSAQQEGAEDRFRYLFDSVPEDDAAFTRWLVSVSTTNDPLFFAVIDKATGRAEGRQALMRIDPAHGVIEIGNILWGPAIARSRVATEALFLLASYTFDTLGYRRFEWKCHSENTPSKCAAERFGFKFEGIFRNHMVVKGENRDTAWYSVIASEWPALRARYEAWLNPANFDEAGQQKKRLSDFAA